MSPDLYRSKYVFRVVAPRVNCGGVDRVRACSADRSRLDPVHICTYLLKKLVFSAARCPRGSRSRWLGSSLAWVVTEASPELALPAEAAACGCLGTGSGQGERAATALAAQRGLLLRHGRAALKNYGDSLLNTLIYRAARLS